MKIKDLQDFVNTLSNYKCPLLRYNLNYRKSLNDSRKAKLLKQTHIKSNTALLFHRLKNSSDTHISWQRALDD